MSIEADGGDVLARVREQGPLVHCMTNVVVAGFTANILLALGASPAMVENREESGDFAAVAGGLLVNLGTLTGERADAMRTAVRSANRAGTPWVLDPVAVGGLRFRTDLAQELVVGSPAVVRGNASEVIGLAGGNGSGRGVDSTLAAVSAAPAAETLIGQGAGCVAVSGAVDHLTDGSDVVAMHNGDPVMTRVTGVGCALGAVVTACTAVGATPLAAAVAGTAIMTVAAEHAAPRCAGPGTFAVHLIDAVADLTPDTLRQGVRLT